MPNEAAIKQWEVFLATAPASIGSQRYTGGQTGKVSPALQGALTQLTAKLKEILGRPVSLNLSQSPNTALQLIGEAQKKLQEPKPQPKPQPAAKPEAQPAAAPKTAQGELVKAWRGYLKVGDPNNPQPDPQLVQAITAAETKISSVVPAAKGMIWQGSQINPQVPPTEYDAALKVMQQAQAKAKPEAKPAPVAAPAEPKKAVAVATLDALGPPPTRDEQPMATKFVLSDEDTKIETGDPMETQQQGIMVAKIPARKRRRKRKGQQKAKRMTMDDRLMQLVDLMAETKKS
jgi:hypothetical protein